MALEMASVVVVSLVFAAFVRHVILGTVDLYLPPDGAHALAEARYLQGERAVNFIHPAVFPSLVLVVRTLFSRENAFLVAMLTAYVAVWGSLHYLVRQWHRPLTAHLATATAMSLPVVAELFGWGGGANLLALAWLAAAAGASEAWCRRGGLRGLVVGAFIGLAVLTHPFVALVTMGCVGVRVAVELVARRAPLDRWGVRSPLGHATVVVGALPCAIAALPYYRGLQSTGTGPIGTPNLDALIDLVGFSAREGFPILIIEVAAALAIIWSPRLGLRWIGLALISAVVAFPLLVRADGNYLVRGMYLVPLITAMGAAILFERMDEFLETRRLDPRSWRRVTVVGLCIAALASGGLGGRLAVGSKSFRRIEAADLAAFDRLRGQEGTVVTSWATNSYAERLSWFVGGLSGRRSVGSIAPWFSTRLDETREGRDALRLFAGHTTVGNERVLVGVGPTSHPTSNALLLAVRGYLVPSAYFGLAPEELTEDTSEAEVDGTTLRWSVREQDRVVGTGSARVESGAMVISYRAVDGGPTNGWLFAIRPTAGVTWPRAFAGPAPAASFRQNVYASTVPVELRASPDSVVDYAAASPQFGGPAMYVRSASSELEIRVTPGKGSPEELESRPPLKSSDPVVSDETSILRRYDVDHVVVWRSAQLSHRFKDAACFEVADATPNLVVYAVDASCR